MLKIAPIRSRNEVHMSKQIHGNQKHLTQDNRVAIEKGLDSGTSLRQIAAAIDKDPSTVSYEIKKHRIMQPHTENNLNLDGFRNKCILRGNCKKENICNSSGSPCKRLCKSCPRCNHVCKDFTPKDYHCPLIDKAPFVCNGCKQKASCRLDKAYYRAAKAHREYRTILIESRNGINISQEDLAALDELISPLIRQGQSPYTICHNHPEIGLSEKTIYNYIDSGALSVRNLDLPKKVKYKVRQVHQSEIKDTGIFENRTYKDYQAFLSLYPDTPVVEMDTVLGCEGSRKVLLTIHFTCCSLMAAFLLDGKQPANVLCVFNRIEKAVTTFLFSKVMPLILTDRGGEFSNPDALEAGTDNTIRTSIYYCDPMCSWQKPHCEKNHEYIRKICPKGTSFDYFTQRDITLMMSHINSSPRESLGGMTPYRLAAMMLPKEFMDFFSFKEIHPDKVNLTPSLLK